MKASKEEGDFRKGRWTWADQDKDTLNLVMEWLNSVSRESFALVKGAVLLLEEGDREELHDDKIHDRTAPLTQEDGASDARRKHLHVMVEQLRPEDTIKLVRAGVYTNWRPGEQKCVHLR